MLTALTILAICGLLFWVYSVVRILKTWWSRDWLNKTIWFAILSLVGTACIGILLMRWT